MKEYTSLQKDKTSGELYKIPYLAKKLSPLPILPLGPCWYHISILWSGSEPKYFGSDPDHSMDIWYQQGPNGNIGRGDNFLARYGILYNSPLVLSFCNDVYSFI